MDSKELRSLMEAYNEVYASENIDEGIRSSIKNIFNRNKKTKEDQPESRGAYLRRKYNVGPEKSDTSAKRQILDRSRARAERDERDYGNSKYSKSVAKKSREAHDRYLKAGYSKYGATHTAGRAPEQGRGSKAARRAETLNREEFDWIIDTLLEDGCDLSNYTEQELYDICCEELEIEEGLRTKIGDKVKKHVNQYAYAQGIHNNPGWLRKPEKRAELNKSVRDDIKKNPKAAVKYVAKQVKKKVTGKLPKTGITGTLESLDLDIFDVILEFLQNEGIAEDLNEATWIMSNVLTEEQIDEILGLFKKKKSTVNKGTASEFAGRSMTSAQKKKPYEVISGKYASPMHTVHSYGPKGEYSKKRSAKV